MNSTCLLGIHAITSLHPGTGAALSAIDLPIQRETHTQWPSIAGSSIKGILRDTVREKLHVAAGNGKKRKEIDEDDSNELTALFGPGKITSTTGGYAGAINITDARLIAFPVRSLKGVYAMVTCPMALHRLVNDAKLAAWGITLDQGIDGISDEQVALPGADSPLRITAGNLTRVMFDEFDFGIANFYCPKAAQAVGSLSPDGAVVGKHLAVVHDNVFTHFVRFATEVNARIGIDYETKTVDTGALFYQEFLPPESLLYCVVQADRARREHAVVGLEQPQAVLKKLRDSVSRQTLQIGGNATTGKGICRVHWSQPIGA